MKKGYPKPAEYLPTWARAYFDRWRDDFNKNDMVPVAPDGTKLWWKRHFPDAGLGPGETLAPTYRHDAFYRLFCTDNNGMRGMWQRADEVIVIDLKARPDPDDGRWFLGDAILGTDATFPDQTLTTHPRLPKPTYRRLSPEQSLAHKAAHLLQCLFHATPPDCYARPHCYFSDMVEWLVARYGFDLGPFDYNRLNRVYNLTYTSDSKRGWIQHRRAHDRIRHEVIAAIRRLIGKTRDPSHLLIVKLRQIADDLATWPDMETEHGHQIELLSNKASWVDWLRHVYNGWLGAIECGEARGHLRQCDWAALAAALFPGHFGAAGAPDESQIGKAIAEVEASRPGRKRIKRERALAEWAALQAQRTHLG